MLRKNNSAENQSRYDLLLKGGHVIDSAGERDGRFDVAIRGGLIPLDDADGLEGALVDLHHNRQFAKPHKGSGAGYSRRGTRAAVWDGRQQGFDALPAFGRRAETISAALTTSPGLRSRAATSTDTVCAGATETLSAAAAGTGAGPLRT